ANSYNVAHYGDGARNGKPAGCVGTTPPCATPTSCCSGPSDPGQLTAGQITLRRGHRLGGLAPRTLDELVIGLVHPAGLQPVAPGRLRPDREVDAFGRLVPAAAARAPDRAGQGMCHLAEEAGHGLGLDVDVVHALVLDLLDALQDVMRLRLDHEDDGVVAQAGVRPDQLVHIGVVGRGDAVVAGGAELPVFLQGVA